MRINNKILKIIGISFPKISFISRNGENREIDLKDYFRKINLEKDDFGYSIIEDIDLFNSVSLESNSLAWKNLVNRLELPSGNIIESFFHLDALVTISYSELINVNQSFSIGEKVKLFRKQQNLTQEDLGKKIGSTKNYISKFENSKTDIEFRTLQKIAEIGLNKKVFIGLYDQNERLRSLSNSILKPAFVEWIGVRKNDLTLIEGIGPQICKHFLREKIFSPVELSQVELPELISILGKSRKSLDFYHNVDSWRIQAKCIVNSDWTNLIILQKSVGGSHSKIENLARKELNEDIFNIE
jgi:transcriptional regulator with XRE-family HTH domain